MAIQLGSAYGKVSLDINGLVNAVRTGKINMQSLAQAGEQMGATLKNVGQNMTLGLTLPILATGAAAIQAASSYEETKNRAMVVFEEMADSIVENSNRAADTLGMSKKEYLDYASSIGAALKAGGMGIKESTELAEQAVKQFSDLGSFYEASTQDVAAAWQSAIRGQYEPIQRYFPFITDSYMKTYGIANGMISANTTNLTANQRAVILNAIALDEKLNPALNDFAETSDSFANSSKSLKSNFNDALIMLGQNLLPVALTVVQALNKMLESFNNMSPGMQKAVIGFAGFLAILGPVISALGTMISFVSGIAGFVSTLSGMGITFAGVSAAIGTAGTALAGFAAAAGAVLLPILLIIGTLALLYLAFKNNFMGITTTAQQLWFILKFYFTQGWQMLLQVSQQRGAQLAAWFRTMLQRIREAFRTINWQEVGRFIIMGIVNGMLGGLPLIIMAAARVARSALDTLKKTLDSRSPSRKTMAEGMNAAQGFMNGLDQGMDTRQLTRSFTRPLDAVGQASNQNVTMNIGAGLTLRQTQRVVKANNEQIFRGLNRALGGA